MAKQNPQIKVNHQGQRSKSTVNVDSSCPLRCGLPWPSRDLLTTKQWGKSPPPRCGDLGPRCGCRGFQQFKALSCFLQFQEPQSSDLVQNVI